MYDTGRAEAARFERDSRCFERDAKRARAPFQSLLPLTPYFRPHCSFNVNMNILVYNPTSTVTKMTRAASHVLWDRAFAYRTRRLRAQQRAPRVTKQHARVGWGPVPRYRVGCSVMRYSPLVG